MNNISESSPNTNGDIKQQIPDKSTERNAVRLVPTISERYPPITQAIPPIPIIKKDNNGILNKTSACMVL